jgi:hypothetical protein
MVKRKKLIREIPVWEMDRTTDTLEIIVPSEMAKELRELVNFYMSICGNPMKVYA